MPLPSDIVAWPFVVGEGVTEQLQWLTDVLEPRYGPPQTRKLRETPRIVLQFDGIESGANARWMETLLSANRAGDWFAPLAIDATVLTAAASGFNVPVDTVGRRFWVGGAVLLQGDSSRDFELGLVTAITDTYLTVETALERDWPAGTAISPAVASVLKQGVTLDRFTGADASYAVEFLSNEPVDFPASFGGETYRGYPVLVPQPDWSSDPAFAHERAVEALDGGTGPVRLYDTAGMPLPQIRMAVTAVGRPQVAELLGLVYALAGRWQPVWVPSLAQDFVVQSAAASSIVDVAWVGVSGWPLRANRRDLRIEMVDGAVVHRRIVSAAELDADTERLVLDADLPMGTSEAGIALVSFMALCQQDSDTNALRLWGSDVVSTEFPFKAINNDV